MDDAVKTLLAAGTDRVSAAQQVRPKAPFHCLSCMINCRNRLGQVQALIDVYRKESAEAVWLRDPGDARNTLRFLHRLLARCAWGLDDRLATLLVRLLDDGRRLEGNLEPTLFLNIPTVGVDMLRRISRHAASRFPPPISTEKLVGAPCN